MMETLWVSLGTALWLGVLTSISPCPMATNLAALSFLSREVSSPFKVVFNGLLYASGRALTYLLISLVTVTSLVSAFDAAHFLQAEMNQILGPVLIVSALLTLGLFRLPGFNFGLVHLLGPRVAVVWGFGPLLLGGLFAMAFCPVSAGLFFGSLIPLSVGLASGVALPALYGIGTAIPVVAVALILVCGTKTISSALGKLAVFEQYTRRFSGWTFLLVGVYLCYRYFF